MAAGRRLPKH